MVCELYLKKTVSTQRTLDLVMNEQWREMEVPKKTPKFLALVSGQMNVLSTGWRSPKKETFWGDNRDKIEVVVVDLCLIVFDVCITSNCT